MATVERDDAGRLLDLAINAAQNPDDSIASSWLTLNAKSNGFVIDRAEARELIRTARSAPRPPAGRDHATRDDTGAAAVLLDPADPHPGAIEFVQSNYMHDGVRTLHEQAGLFYAYDGRAYPALEVSTVRAQLWEFAAGAKRRQKEAIVPFQPTTPRVNNLIDAVRAVAHLPSTIAAPCWLDGGSDAAPPKEIIAMSNGLLHVWSRNLQPSTPRFYTHNALDFAYSPDQVQPPVAWLKFLRELWGDDTESIAVLQEMCGYFLLPDTSQQKTFLLVGPKRSGKGTIGRIITELLGPSNVCGPSLASLSTNFGKWPLIGKLLAIISDARLGGRADQSAIAETLLAISGEDAVTIDRKHLPPWTGRLPTRFLLLSNELPRLADTSGALASRFIVLSLERSFYGQEDSGLTERLRRELPAIFMWALDGWDRLRRRGYFVQPASSAEAVRALEDLGSPVTAFIRDRCAVGAGRTVEVNRLYAAWQDWCRSEGRDHAGTRQTFGRDLKAAVAGVKVSNPLRVDGDRVRFYEGIGLS
jgi:putative DNA primase/helicase